MIIVFILAQLGAAVWDLAFGKIPKFITIPLWLLGMAIACQAAGWSGLGLALAAMITAIFWLQMPGQRWGGGDIKLLLATAPWVGALGVIILLAYAAVLRLPQVLWLRWVAGGRSWSGLAVLVQEELVTAGSGTIQAALTPYRGGWTLALGAVAALLTVKGG